ncbi:MAG: hypothetical protein V8Q84_05150, partial [Bilophila sp.]
MLGIFHGRSADQEQRRFSPRFLKNGAGVGEAFLRGHDHISVGGCHIHEAEKQVGRRIRSETGAVFGKERCRMWAARMPAGPEIVEGRRRNGETGCGGEPGQTSHPSPGGHVVHD